MKTENQVRMRIQALELELTCTENKKNSPKANKLKTQIRELKWVVSQ